MTRRVSVPPETPQAKAERTRAMAYARMAAKEGWCWDEDLRSIARRVYVDERRSAKAAAEAVTAALSARGVTAICRASQVANIGARHGWRRAGKARRRDLTAGEAEQIRAWYLVDLVKPEIIAGRLGWTAASVRHFVCRRGWPALLPAGVLEGWKREQLAQALVKWKAMGLKPPDRSLPSRARVTPAPKLKAASSFGEGRGLPEDIRLAIDAAVAAGRLTVLPSGRAAGLTTLESQFWAARADLAEGGWRAAAARAKARAGIGPSMGLGVGVE